jgi:hypothetical protein
VIVIATEVVIPLSGRLEGLNEHEARLGSPEQLKLIGPVKCRVGDIDITMAAAWPARTVTPGDDVEIRKSGLATTCSFSAGEVADR